MRRLLAATVVAVAALIGLATPAAAHATLRDTTPKNGAHVESSPKRLTLTYSESVDVSLGSIKLFNADGHQVALGEVGHAGGAANTVAAEVPKLRDGAYVVTWRVLSADSHPVQGAFTFVVGNARAADDASIASLLQQRGGSRLVGVAYAASRAIAFASMLLLVGGLSFLVVVWPAGRAVRGAHRAAWLALVVLAAASVANLLLQGVYAAGLGIAKAVDPDVVGNVVDTRFGRVYLIRLALLAVAAALVAAFFRGERLARVWPWLAAPVGVALVATPGFAGHASIGSNEPYALIADVAHVGGASVWIGGLAMLTLFVLPRRTDDLKAIVRRFSDVAFWAVVVLVGTGVFQGWRQVGTRAALTSTAYGKLLVVKTAFVALMLGVAWLSRRSTQARWSPDTAARVRTSVAIETGVAVAVLVVTSLLVNAVPAKTVAAAPQSGELTSATMLLDYTVSPGRTGPNEIHLYALTKTGQPQAVEEMTMKLSLPGRGIAPIPVELEIAGTGHYQSLRFQVPIKGRWRVDVTARTSAVDQEVFEGTIDIR